MPLQLPKDYKPFTDADAYPIGTVVRLLKTNEFAIVRSHTFQFNGKGFLNYLCEMERREQGALYCCFTMPTNRQLIEQD